MSSPKPDGGAAFPSPADRHPESHELLTWAEPGMTLRDYFAARAMMAIINKLPLFDAEKEHGRPSTREDNLKINAEVAESAYYYADAMITARQSS